MAKAAPVVLALVLLLTACGGNDDEDSNVNPLAGVWQGEQATNDAQAAAEPLCMLVAQSTPIAPGQFSGGMYLSGALLGIVAGTLEADGTVTVATEVNIYEGTRAGDRFSGTWGASAEEVVPAGTWTLERTDGDSC